VVLHRFLRDLLSGGVHQLIVYGIYPVDEYICGHHHRGVATKASHPLLKRVGVRLRKARRTKGLSQEALAHAANMDRSFVSGLERGEFNVSLLALAKLSRVLSVPLSALVDGEPR
jgi:ribosome-binding protein aMBF1 (putative translation factor)